MFTLNELTNALGSPEIVPLLLSNKIILLFKLHATDDFFAKIIFISECVCVCVCLFVWCGCVCVCVTVTIDFDFVFGSALNRSELRQ